jgi:hypothetical protein
LASTIFETLHESVALTLSNTGLVLLLYSISVGSF